MGWEGLRFLPNVLFSKGWFGVQIFFVISGMVLALPFAAAQLRGDRLPALKSYFMRRLIRIEVPYFIVLTLMFLWHWLFLGASFTENLPNYGAGLVYLHHLIYDGALNPLLPVSWTLEIEIQFYLLAPVLCQVFKIRRTLWRRTLLLGAIFAIQPLTDWSVMSPFENTLLPRLDYFLAGMLLADFHLLRNPSQSGSVRIWWDVIGVMSWLGVFLLLETSTMVNLKPFVLLISFWAVLRGGLFRKLASFPWVTSIGMMCYTIYLFHELFIYSIFNPFVFGRIIPVEDGEWPLNSILMLLMAFFVILLSAGTFLLIEKPFSRGKWPFAPRKRS